MNKVVYFNRANSLQRCLYSNYKALRGFFRPDLTKCPFEAYRPKLSKVRVTTGLITGSILFVIPFFPDYLFWNKIGRFMIK